jgi:hypothetical protein
MTGGRGRAWGGARSDGDELDQCRRRSHVDDVEEEQPSKLHRYFTEVSYPYRDMYLILRYIDTSSIPYQRCIRNTVK